MNDLFEVFDFKDEKDWLSGRMNGIGGSDASSVVGMNPYKSNINLFEEKTGRRIPEDISLVGYDGIDLSRFFVPRLTTVRQDTAQMAKQGVDLMLQRIHYPYKAVHKVIPYELIKSESVKKIN